MTWRILDLATASAFSAATTQRGQLEALAAPWAGGNVTVRWLSGTTLLRTQTYGPLTISSATTPYRFTLGRFIADTHVATGTADRVILRAGSTDIVQKLLGGTVTLAGAIKELCPPNLEGVSITANSVLPIDSVAGVLIGATGATGSLFEGFRLADGDDFALPPARWTGRNFSGGYAHSALTVGFRRTAGADSAMYIDPAFRGARSQSPTDLGYDGVSVSGGVATFTASAPATELVPFLPTDFTGGGDGSNRPRLVSGSLKTAPRLLLSAQADFIIDCKVRVPAGVARGWWPSFWTTTFFWPDGQEYDVFEAIKDGSGNVSNLMNLNGSTTDGGANVTVNIGSQSIPTGRWVQIVGRKIGTTLSIYTDAVTEGTLALAATYTNSRVARFRGVHDIRLDLAVQNAWDSSTFNAGDWPKAVEFDYWRAWVPSAAAANTPLTVLSAVNTTPGGSWAATLPATSTLSGGKAGREEIFGVFDNTDAPGQPTRNSVTKYPGGMSVNASTRAVTGTVPTTEGGRSFLMVAYAFDDGTPAARALLPFNVAPAVQPSLFASQNITPGAAVSFTIAYTDFHSGNLGPHTYNVTKVGGAAVTISGNGTGAVTIGGTAPAASNTVVFTINCTNSIGQTTTVTRTLTAVSAWTPAAWTSLYAWYDAQDGATVFVDTGGATPATIDSSSVGRWSDKSGRGFHVTEASAKPTYITDGILSKPAVKFTAASTQRLVSDAAGLAAIASGNDNGYTVVMAARRGTPGVSMNPVAFSSTSAPTHYNRHVFSGGNAVGIVRAEAGVTSSALSSAVVTSDTWYIVTVVYTGTAVSAWVNGTLVVNAAALDTGAVTIERFALGALWENNTASWVLPFGGALGEVFVSDDTSRTSDVVAAEQFLSTKWGITLS